MPSILDIISYTVCICFILATIITFILESQNILITHNMTHDEEDNKNTIWWLLLISRLFLIAFMCAIIIFLFFTSTSSKPEVTISEPLLVRAEGRPSGNKRVSPVSIELTPSPNNKAPMDPWYYKPNTTKLEVPNPRYYEA